MKLWIISDLHCDHAPWRPPAVPDHDVLVIAGDLGYGALDAIAELLRIRRRAQRQIVFVPGNHDYFGDCLDRFDDVQVVDVHVLPAGQTVVVAGVRFVGATLWTDFALAGDVYASQAWASRTMPEYQRMTGPDGDLLWPEHTAAAHELHRAAIDRVLRQPHDGPTIVVTHHAPSPLSCGHTPVLEDAAYASDLTAMIRARSPNLWIHGHIHRRSDYVLENTRIIANPRGYDSDDWSENPDFDPCFVVELPV